MSVSRVTGLAPAPAASSTLGTGATSWPTPSSTTTSDTRSPRPWSYNTIQYNRMTLQCFTILYDDDPLGDGPAGDRSLHWPQPGGTDDRNQAGHVIMSHQADCGTWDNTHYHQILLLLSAASLFIFTEIYCTLDIHYHQYTKQVGGYKIRSQRGRAV